MKDDPQESRSNNGSVPIPKAATHIRGVDDVLHGGIPAGRTTLVGGGPGSGKTLFALEQVYRAAHAGEPGVFVTFEEQADAIRRNALAMGWDLDVLERDGRLVILQPPVPVGAVQSGEFDLGGLLALLTGHVKSIGAKRVVIDALDVLLRLFHDQLKREDQVFLLNSFLTDQAVTTVITIKSHANDGVPYQLEFLTDCVIRLDQRVFGQVSTRRLRVLKFRGSSYLSNEYPFVVTANGIVLMPISNASLQQPSNGAKFPSGVSGLDPLLNGGLIRGSCILVGGASGTGKTTFACSIADAAVERGENVLYITFEETQKGLVDTMQSCGIDLAPAIDSGKLIFMAALPEERGVEEHLWRIFDIFDTHNPQHVVVDAISACQRMGSEEAAFNFLLRLLTYCKGRGVACVFLNQTNPGIMGHHISGVGISSLVDALIVLEQEWPEGVHRRQLLIVKVRGARHSHDMHGFRITDVGIEIEDVENAELKRKGAPAT